MKSIPIRVLSIGAALMIGAAVLFAQGPHGHGGPDGMFGHMLGFYADALDLTSAQQDQIKAIWQKEKPTMKPLMQQMHQNRAATDELVENGPFDEAKTHGAGDSTCADGNCARGRARAHEIGDATGADTGSENKVPADGSQASGQARTSSAARGLSRFSAKGIRLSPSPGRGKNLRTTPRPAFFRYRIRAGFSHRNHEHRRPGTPLNAAAPVSGASLREQVFGCKSVGASLWNTATFFSPAL